MQVTESISNAQFYLYAIYPTAKTQGYVLDYYFKSPIAQLLSF